MPHGDHFRHVLQTLNTLRCSNRCRDVAISHFPTGQSGAHGGMLGASSAEKHVFKRWYKHLPEAASRSHYFMVICCTYCKTKNLLNVIWTNVLMLPLGIQTTLGLVSGRYMRTRWSSGTNKMNVERMKWEMCYPKGHFPTESVYSLSSTFLH